MRTYGGLGEIQEGAGEGADLAADAAGRKHPQQRVSQVGLPELPPEPRQPLCSVPRVHGERPQACQAAGTCAITHDHPLHQVYPWQDVPLVQSYVSLLCRDGM